MKILKIGQIGLGHAHGEGKMLAVQKFPELFEVVGYAEDDENWVKDRSDYSAYRGLRRFESVDELLRNCDVVLVETEVWNLTKYAQRCVDVGKHVHVDKPASGTLAEFAQLLDSAKAKNLTVQMGYMYRYNRAIRKCLELIKSGELGEIYRIDAEMSTFHPPEYRKWLGNFRGGSMYIFGCHLIDLVILAIGKPKRVIPFIKQTGLGGVYSDDNATAILEYDKAIAGITTLSCEVNGWGMRRFAVMGSRGMVEIKPLELNVKMTLATRDFAKNAYADMKEKLQVPDVPRADRYDEMVKELYFSAIGEKPNPYSYEHELLLQEVLYQVTGEN